jgi:hypothetical protein
MRGPAGFGGGSVEGAALASTAAGADAIAAGAGAALLSGDAAASVARGVGLAASERLAVAS